MKNNIIHREKYTGKSLVEMDGKIISISDAELNKKYSIHGVIRLWPKDFALLKNHKYLTHFNLQISNHKKGKRYALVKILKPGYFDGEKEILPILTFKDAAIAQCISTREHVGYDSIIERDFTHSFRNIQNVTELKKEILRRYKKSMAHVSDKKKLGVGVGITELKILRRIKR